MDVTESQSAAIQSLLASIGEEAFRMATQPFQVFEKGRNDYVTSVDQALDAQLLQQFEQLFPEDGVITEENLKSKRAFHRGYSRLWLIDPIDGTEDFMNQGSEYAVMVGLLSQDRPQAGWVYAPARHCLYWGGNDWGLHYQPFGEPSQPLVPSPPSFSEASCPIMIGDKDLRRFGDAISQHIPNVTFKSLGSFGLKVLEVIQGHVGLYLYLNGRVKLWDTVGPLALAETAGLICCDLDGNPLQFDEAAVDNQTLIHRQSILVGWPNYIHALRPLIKQAADQVLRLEAQKPA